MIKDIKFRISCDSRGKITTGQRSDRGYPQPLDHFNISEFSELQAVYGLSPQKLVLYFPSDTITDFYDCNYNAWGTNMAGDSIKKRTCDGERCIHRIKEGQYEAGEESECVCQRLAEDDNHRCRYDCYFKAFVGDPRTGKIHSPTCYMFETHSKNSGDAVYSELEKIRALNMGTLRAVPFILSVKMVGSAQVANKKFPIWSLQAVGTLAQIAETSGKGLFQTIGQPLLETIPAQKALQSPVEAPTPQPSQATSRPSQATQAPAQAPDAPNPVIDAGRLKYLQQQAQKAEIDPEDLMDWLDFAFEYKSLESITMKHYNEICKVILNDRATILNYAERKRKAVAEEKNPTKTDADGMPW